MENNNVLKGFDLNWFSKYRDELFGIAILTVMFFHFGMLHVDFYEGSQTLSYAVIKWCRYVIANVGVDMFVFLSGMGLYYSFSKNGDIGAFYKRRFMRILIPYIIAGGLHRVVTDMVYTHLSFKQMLLNFSFVTFFTEGINNFWFIFFIGTMYLIFPIIYKLVYNEKYGRLWFIVLLALSIAGPIVLYVQNHDLYKNIGIAITRVPIFIVGTYAGRPIKECRHIPHIAALAIIAIGIVCKYYSLPLSQAGYQARYMTSFFGLSMLFICTYVLRALSKAEILRRILRFFGRYSLEFYLLHIMLWGILGGQGMQLHRMSHYGIMILIAAALAPLLSKITSLITRLLGGRK